LPWRAVIVIRAKEPHFLPPLLGYLADDLMGELGYVDPEPEFMFGHLIKVAPVYKDGE